jgi:hypothetical protein
MIRLSQDPTTRVSHLHHRVVTLLARLDEPLMFGSERDSRLRRTSSARYESLLEGRFSEHLSTTRRFSSKNR